MNAHQILVKARNLLDREGHAKHALRDETGYCQLGARNMATFGTQRFVWGHPDRKAFHAAKEALTDAVGVPSEELVDWNNAPERTKEEVLAAFDRAIAATAPPPDFGQLREHLELFAEAAALPGEGK